MARNAAAERNDVIAFARYHSLNRSAERINFPHSLINEIDVAECH